MPTGPYFYPKVNKATIGAFLADMARFLINDLGGYTGPGWTIVEAYDANSAGTKRRVPTGGDESNMDNAAFAAGADFGWQLDSLGDGDWIVLRSKAATTGTYFQLYLELDSVASARVYFKLIPYDNFATGGLDVSPPTLPANSVGSGASLVDFTLPAVVASNYSIVADESMVMFVVDQGSANVRGTYVGELDGARDNGTPADDRPFVLWTYPTYWMLYTGGAYWHRVSPADDATLLASGYFAVVYGGDVVHGAGNDGNYLSRWTVLPLGVYFSDAGNKHFAGWLRNMGSVSANAATSGTINSMTWMFLTANTGYGRLAVAWDGVTAY